jgi:hypothetical protein
MYYEKSEKSDVWELDRKRRRVEKSIMNYASVAYFREMNFTWMKQRI